MKVEETHEKLCGIGDCSREFVQHTIVVWQGVGWCGLL